MAVRTMLANRGSVGGSHRQRGHLRMGIEPVVDAECGEKLELVPAGLRGRYGIGTPRAQARGIEIPAAC